MVTKSFELSEEISNLPDQKFSFPSSNPPESLTFISKKKKLFIYVIAVIFIFLFFLSLILAFVAGYLVAKTLKNSINSECFSCKNDGFSYMVYEVNGTAKTLKYKSITSMNEKMYFGNVSNYCKLLNSSLWGVLDGETEWQAMVINLRNNPTMEIWLNGTTVEKCPSGSTDCKKNEAKIGQGLKVVYENSTYSRLYKSFQSQKTCLFVENSIDLLWSVGYCQQEERTGFCVKRNCC